MGDCHECSCFVNPPCGACENCKHWYVDDCPNDCQLCEYDHERSGPYKLADGTWSDGVDRTHRINERKFGEANPQRIRIVCQRTLVGVWKPEAMPFQGEIPISWDDFTHAEAIAYADRMARTNQGENK